MASVAIPSASAHDLHTGSTVLTASLGCTPGTINAELPVIVWSSTVFSVAVDCSSGVTDQVGTWISDEVRNAGTIVAMGADAATDYAANRRLTLPRTNSRVMGVSGSGTGLTARTIGDGTGEENNLITIAEMPAHTHPRTDSLLWPTSGAGGSNYGAGTTALTLEAAQPSQGGDTALNIMQPSAWANLEIKL